MLDNVRWNRLISILCKGGGNGHWFNQLVAAYNQSHRYYHDAHHIIHCLQQFDQVVQIAQHPHEVEFAIWLHDAVYEPQASDNEEKSAALAVRILSSLECDKALTQRIPALILATRHDQPPTTDDALLLLDIDLSSLGHAPEQYNQYETAIRAEYAWMPDDSYRQKRRQVLTEFLNRPRIFYTDLFYTRYETQARANINRALTDL